MEYVTQDAITTMEIYKASSINKSVTWTSLKGRLQYVPIGEWLPITECLKMPLPDQSWMNKPTSRGSFTEWIDAGEII
jgi:hypothetical protein